MSSPRPSLTSGGKRSNTCPKTHPRRAFSLFIPKRQCSTFHQESSMLASTNHQHTARGEVTFMEMRKMSGSRTQAKPPTDPQTEELRSNIDIEGNMSLSPLHRTVIASNVYGLLGHPSTRRTSKCL
ncbi:uncharacterized protein LOC117812061 isoform X2 [Notolabrus celidotus]|uniref:uncharacterized protein LOC117812061 isoform X2 n=1 Tax=Notolabrus celidotus TaxID=1203425 RepID=UPI00148F9B5A|nr:uncharacterized protein LOC117812061 isoform X2 [Notolabrus celidotus]